MTRFSSPWRNRPLGKLSLLAFILWGLCFIPMITHWYQYQREIMGYKNRAQVAGNAEDMQEYLKDMKEGMKKNGMTSGHYALIFKHPWNDISRDLKAVNRAIERLDKIKRMNRNSVEYQTGMDDVRGIIRELKLQPTCWWLVNKALGYFLLLLFGWIPAAILFAMRLYYD